jgi:hypothetical protein
MEPRGAGDEASLTPRRSQFRYPHKGESYLIWGGVVLGNFFIGLREEDGAVAAGGREVVGADDHGVAVGASRPELIPGYASPVPA